MLSSAGPMSSASTLSKSMSLFLPNRRMMNRSHGWTLAIRQPIAPAARATSILREEVQIIHSFRDHTVLTVLRVRKWQRDLEYEPARGGRDARIPLGEEEGTDAIPPQAAPGRGGGPGRGGAPPAAPLG